jgi:hypothetical protein
LGSPLKRTTVLLACSIICYFGLVACNLSLPSRATATPVLPSATPIPTATATPVPSPTPQPLAILIAPPGADPNLTSAMQTLLTQLSNPAGWRVQVLPSVASTDLGAEVQVVVSLPPDPGVASLAAAAPATRFVAVGMPDVHPANNLFVVGAQGDRPDRQGFLAGDIAAAITPDWRIGVINREDTGAGKAARQGFFNGATYYCGLCRSAYPPFYEYPLYAELPAQASQAEQQAAADYMIDHAAKTVYVYPGAGDDALLEYLAQNGVNLIGGVTPPQAAQNQWVASIQPDLLKGFRDLWPRLIKGEPGASVEVPLGITNANPSLFSPGRQRLAQTTLDDLLAGFIDTGVDPQTGELR